MTKRLWGIFGLTFGALVFLLVFFANALVVQSRPDTAAITQAQPLAQSDAVADVQLYKYELDKAHIERCQKFLNQMGHGSLTAVEGTSFTTKKGMKEKTFVIILKCVDRQANVFCVAIFYVKDELDSIEVKATGERMPSS